MSKTEFTVTEPTELLPFLLQCFPDMSRTKVKELMGHSVVVDGRRTSQFNFPLLPGMVVGIVKANYRQRFRNSLIDIVYEDDFLVVINKHEGVLSYSRKPSDVTAISEVNKYFAYTHQKCNAHVVHRLDRDTSGLMVVSKTKQTSQKFEADWKGLVYDRAYVAVAWGKVEPPQDTIRTWLTDGEYCVLSSPVDNGGKEAITHYEVLQTSRRYSLLSLRLDTGRRNQIRVHLRELKHPVVHDPMYGYKDDVSPINRLALHAYRLCFTHPITGKRLEFETPFPAAFLKLMEL
ncbi:MAG: RluA family pseudouridine synthase [Bacteroidales bacterium]|nr:RluA family pseudouridine synthase [Bacteroidales bacterium]